MAESAALVTKVTSANVPDTTPTNVAVVVDASSNARQIVAIGASDGSAGLADVVPGDAGYSGLATAGATKTYSFTTSVAGAQTLLPATSCEGYQWIEIIYSSVGVGLALTCPFSPTSGGTYAAWSTWSPGPLTAAVSALGTSNAALYSGPTKGNFFQLAITALTSGTFTGTVTLRATPPPLANLNIPQMPQAGTNGDAVANPTTTQISANALVYNGASWDRQRSMGALPASASTGVAAAGITGIVRRSTITALTDAYQAQAALDMAGAQLVSIGGAITGTVAAGAQAAVVKGSAGRICRVLVTTAGTVATTIYDNASTNSGTVVGVIPAAAVAGSVYDIQMPCANGIYAYAASGGAALTVSYT